PEPSRSTRSVARGERLQSQSESRARDPPFARKNRPSAAPPIQPALRNSTNPDRVIGRTWTQTKRLKIRKVTAAKRPSLDPTSPEGLFAAVTFRIFSLFVC